MDQIVRTELPAEFQHANERLAGYPVTREPFEYFLIEDIFSPGFYQDLLSKLPADSAYKWMKSSDVREQNRGLINLNRSALVRLPAQQRAFWTDVQKWLLSSVFIEGVMSKFGPEIARRFEGEKKGSRVFAELKLLRDKVNYALKPHTDSVNRVLTLMVYLPKDESRRQHGTAIYRPKQSGFRCAGGGRHAFEDFELVTKAPFLPNSGLCFLKSDTSFHGVEPVNDKNDQRDILSFTLRCRKETPKERVQRLFASARGIEDAWPVETSYL
jgi:hypothetical protein